MPAVGDQHKSNGNATANPFDESKPPVSEYTAKEIATLQSRLDKQLGPEYISTRAGPGGQKVHYLAAEKVINLANEIFGFNGWSSSIQNIQIDFVDENPQTGKISLGLSVIVRVILKDGTYREDIGYGHIENCKGKAAAFEKAKKEGTTDALKRALRTFGNALGNCIKDKDYISKVTKVRIGTGKWDVDALHRHPDFAPKKESDSKPDTPLAMSNDSCSKGEIAASFDFADFDDAEFDEVGFDENDLVNPDEVVVPADPPVQQNPTFRQNAGQQIQRSYHKFDPAVPPLEAREKAAASFPNARPTAGLPPTANVTAQRQPITNSLPATVGVRQPLNATAMQDQRQTINNQRFSSPGRTSPHFQVQEQLRTENAIDPAPTPGFYSAKAATSINAENNVTAKDSTTTPKFNPYAESPSIRKTAGVDHSRSIPLKKDLKPDLSMTSKDFVEPRSDQTRRVGLPSSNIQSPASKVSGVSAYRPPTRRGLDSVGASITSLDVVGGVDKVLAVTKRAPLVDVSNVQHTVTALTPDGADAKRQKVRDQERIDGGENQVDSNAEVG